MATTPEAPVATRSKYEPVIGLEVHVQLLTKTKIFCGCSTRFGDPPNTNVCPVCLGLPGALPVLNRQAVEFAVLAAMALNCRINETSIFARKNYFYPDLPKGYQISQYDKPIAEHGYIEIEGANGPKRIGITRLHMEEDAGKSLHDGLPDSSDWTSIDLNRTGTPLIEIVSEPDIATPDEAYEYLTKLKEIILYTGVSDCNMEEGSLRCDANVSIRPVGQREFGTKTEIKNVNSFRFIREAIEYEIGRQEQRARLRRAHHAGDAPLQRGRGQDLRHALERRGARLPLLPRARPAAAVVDEKWRTEIAANLPELPEARRARFIEQYGVSKGDAYTLTVSRSRADQFEEAAAAAKSPKRVANLVNSELLGRLKAKGLDLEQSPISMKGVAMSADLVESGAISGKQLKDLYDIAFERGEDFPAVYEREKPQQITDTPPSRRSSTRSSPPTPSSLSSIAAARRRWPASSSAR